MRPFRYLLRVRYSECDAQKVVFNARYGEYVDLGVSMFIRALGYNPPGRPPDFDFQVVRQTTQWRAPVRFDEVLELALDTLQVGTTSFTVRTEMRIAGQEAVTTTAETVYVNVDPVTMAKSPITDAMRTVLLAGAPGVVIDHAAWLR